MLLEPHFLAATIAVNEWCISFFIMAWSNESCYRMDCLVQQSMPLIYWHEQRSDCFIRMEYKFLVFTITHGIYDYQWHGQYRYVFKIFAD